MSHENSLIFSCKVLSIWALLCVIWEIECYLTNDNGLFCISERWHFISFHYFTLYRTKSVLGTELDMETDTVILFLLHLWCLVTTKYFVCVCMF